MTDLAEIFLLQEGKFQLTLSKYIYNSVGKRVSLI